MNTNASAKRIRSGRYWPSMYQAPALAAVSLCRHESLSRSCSIRHSAANTAREPSVTRAGLRRTLPRSRAIITEITGFDGSTTGSGGSLTGDERLVDHLLHLNDAVADGIGDSEGGADLCPDAVEAVGVVGQIAFAADGVGVQQLEVGLRREVEVRVVHEHRHGRSLSFARLGGGQQIPAAEAQPAVSLGVGDHTRGHSGQLRQRGGLIAGQLVGHEFVDLGLGEIGDLVGCERAPR